MDHISFSVTENCYAVVWSYGEICVHCNCCGRYEKGLKMWEARLNFHKIELERGLNFSNWAEDPRVVKTQKAIQKENISYERAKIRYCKRTIKRISK